MADADRCAEGQRRHKGCRCGVRAMMTSGLETSIPVEQTLASHDPDGKHSESKTTDSADGASASTDQASHDVAIETRQRTSKWLCTKRIVVFGIFPALALILAAGSGYLK